MHQTWLDLLFMHWRVSVESVRHLIPRELEIDTFDGSSWIAVVPFWMTNIRPRNLPSVPSLSTFPELNVRTYVTNDGKPGVWFFSLDAGNALAVWLARTWFKLPYYNAKMQIETTALSDLIRYQSQRTHQLTSDAEFIADYKPVGDTYFPQPNTLEYFLTARYCLYTSDAHGKIYRGEIDHAPWSLQIAEADILKNTMTEPIGIALTAEKPLLHFSKKLDVVVWSIKQI
jgi:hypothetical protein